MYLKYIYLHWDYSGYCLWSPFYNYSLIQIRIIRHKIQFWIHDFYHVYQTIIHWYSQSCCGSMSDGTCFRLQIFTHRIRSTSIVIFFFHKIIVIYVMSIIVIGIVLNALNKLFPFFCGALKVVFTLPPSTLLILWIECNDLK